MKPIRIALLSAVLTAGLGVFATPPAVAQRDHGHDQALARRLRESGEILPLEKIVERARAERPGDVLDTELKTRHGRYVYEVEILDARGQVWELKFDARDGSLIRVERED